LYVSVKRTHVTFKTRSTSEETWVNDRNDLTEFSSFDNDMCKKFDTTLQVYRFTLDFRLLE